MRRPHPHSRLIILDQQSPMGRLELQVAMRLSPERLRLGDSRLRMVVAYHPATPSLN